MKNMIKADNLPADAAPILNPQPTTEQYALQAVREGTTQAEMMAIFRKQSLFRTVAPDCRRYKRHDLTSFEILKCDDCLWFTITEVLRARIERLARLNRAGKEADGKARGY